MVQKEEVEIFIPALRWDEQVESWEKKWKKRKMKKKTEAPEDPVFETFFTFS